ncbi:papain-like cysteine protease family protein [Microbulbifer elongatus]|uniref:papain-like cysteine protease family protein n=1 Tax=Microbulbifer elongatus TaxID=86173 RepID=UPI001F4B62EE
MRLKGPFRKIFGMSKRDHNRHAVDLGNLEYLVPFVHQNHCNLCGDSSAEMLLLFHGKNPAAPLKANGGHANSWRMRVNPRGVLSGASDDDVANVITGRGLQAWGLEPTVGRWSVPMVYRALSNYGPYAQSVRFSVAGHWVVVIGVDANHVIYHDPWRGQNMRQTEAKWIASTFSDIYSTVAAVDPAYGAQLVHPDGFNVQQK